MRKILLSLVLLVICYSFADAQTQLGKLKGNSKTISAASKGIQSLTISDATLKAYADQSTASEDTIYKLCTTTDKDAKIKAYAIRLEKITAQIPADLVEKYSLDIKAYHVDEVNAFARPNGAIRIYTSLMDLMTDDQILAVIGHEIGHVVNKDARNAYATALRVSALMDVVGTAGNATLIGSTIMALTGSQLSSLAEALSNAQYSQLQENGADDYAYEFMKRSGKNPANMASSLGVLLKLQEAAGTSTNIQYGKKLFSSHPDLKKRIARLNIKTA